MAGYIIVDVKTKKTIAICSAVALVLFVIGILVGYFSGKSVATATDDGAPNTASIAEAVKASCSQDIKQTPAGETYFRRYAERLARRTVCVNSKQDCLDFGLPRHYISHHLNGKEINMDGKLDEEAWNEVPWSETFVDMRSVVYPKPYLDTKFKMRWDNERMYIGVYIQEKNMWATLKEHDSSIWKENGFEVLMDVDGTMFNYKQMQINVLGTMMDQSLYKSPYDRGFAKAQKWHPDARAEVYTEGTPNKPGDEDKFWSVEMSFSFKALKFNSTRIQADPVDGETWFIQFGRSEQKLNVTSEGTYEKIANSKPDWWSWQPCDVINLHLQDRWGLVQFKRNIKDNVFRFEKWHIYKSLFDMRDAMVIYKAVNGRYTDKIEELAVPPYLLSGTCVYKPEIKLTRTNVSDFEITVKSKFLSHQPAHIRSDRYVTFR